MTRIYFNIHEDEPRVWSVDSGPGTPVVSVTEVYIIDAAISTRYLRDEGEVGDVITPYAWLQISDPVEVEYRGDPLVAFIHSYAYDMRRGKK